MPRVFISHAKEDKGRLAKYVHLLLDDPELSALGAELWIDRPRDVVDPKLPLLRFGDHPRVRGIEIGEEWDDEIADALTGCDCVIGFWSRATLDAAKKRVLHQELSYAQITRKLVPALLDSPELAPLPTDWLKKPGQAVDLSVDDGVRFCDVLVAAKRRLAQCRMSPPPTPTRLPLAKRPFLVDRTGHVTPMCAAAHSLLERQPSRDGEAPALFLVPCQEADAADQLIERIVKHDGPEYLTASGMETVPHWSELMIAWEAAANPDDLREAVRGELASGGTKLALAHAERHRVPVCFWAQFPAYESKSRHEDLIAAWLSFWHSEAPTLIRRTSARGSQRLAPIVVLFVVVRQVRSLFGGRSTVPPDCENLCRRAAAASNVTMHEPKFLQRVGPQHAEQWIRVHLPDVEQRDSACIDGLKSDVKTLFGAHKSGLAMQEFVDALRGRESWARVLKSVSPI